MIGETAELFLLPVNGLELGEEYLPFRGRGFEADQDPFREPPEQQRQHRHGDDDGQGAEDGCVVAECRSSEGGEGGGGGEGRGRPTELAPQRDVSDVPVKFYLFAKLYEFHFPSESIGLPEERNRAGPCEPGLIGPLTRRSKRSVPGEPAVLRQRSARQKAADGGALKL